MRIPLLAIAAGTSLLLTPPAQAAPIKNPWSGTGRLATRSCPEPPLIKGGVPYPREYLTAMLKCLNKAWSAHFARSGLRFSPPTVRFYDGPQREVCGLPWPDGAAAFYCANRRILVLPLAGEWIEGRTDLYPLKVAAHEYAHHLQTLTGISRAHFSRPTEQSRRRYELQADCLAGVFLASVAPRRPAKDWTALVESTRSSGDEYGYRSHGKGANRAYWLSRGFTTASPGSCDTWSAPSAKTS